MHTIFSDSIFGMTMYVAMFRYMKWNYLNWRWKGVSLWFPTNDGIWFVCYLGQPLIIERALAIVQQYYDHTNTSTTSAGSSTNIVELASGFKKECASLAWIVLVSILELLNSNNILSSIIQSEVRWNQSPPVRWEFDLDTKLWFPVYSLRPLQFLQTTRYHHHDSATIGISVQHRGLFPWIPESDCYSSLHDL